jgi:hypothetical protein
MSQILIHWKVNGNEYPPTGNKSYEAVHIHTIDNDGKIIEHKAIRDDLMFMMQLGLVKARSPEYEKFFKAWKEIE